MGSRTHVRVRVKANTYLYLALLLICIPVQWLFAWVAAVAAHEIGHWLAVRLCGVNVTDLTVGLGGITMESELLSNRKRFACILCGPLFGVLPVLLGRWFPRVALCCWMLTAYNLVPVQPLDGGNALRIIIGNDKIHRVTEKIILVLLTACAGYFAICTGLGIIPLLIALLLWAKNRNTPCNTRPFKVQ